MIKANELRIGNSVKISDVEIIVSPNDFKNYCDGLYNFKNFSPIKLTEEIALRLDFEKDNSENNKTYLSPTVNGSRMKIYFNRFGVAKFTMNMFHQVEIENIHTLQNLFFALYSSELVFSTEP